jgi:transcriptional regulator with PAS, ATPase and Fis domain
MDGKPSFGVVVFDDRGRVRYADGLGSDAEIQDFVRSLLAPDLGAEKPVMAFEAAGRRFMALARRAEGATVFLVHEGRDDDALLDFVSRVPFAGAILRHFISSPFEAVTVVDDQARLRYMSPVHEEFFGLRRGESAGRHVTEVIENTRLHEVIASGRAEIGQVQEMRGVQRVVSRVPIVEGGRVVGAIGRVMFKAPQTLIEMANELSKLRSEVGAYRREISELKERSHGLERIVGRSEPVRQLKADILKVAPLDVPVLLLGESGTGKELAAQAIHMLGPRRGHDMVLVNAAALPASLVESELFGYEPGSFTGAERRGRRGKFEQAHGSSLFLDEIGDMPLEVQAKLLRVLEDGRFERLGGDKLRHSDFRLISATNRDLQAMIGENRFRLDLYYRLSPVILRLPPLRERLDDIPLLVQSFVEAFNRRMGTHIRHVEPAVLDHLRTLPWPGNIRQLQHEVERAMIFSEGQEIALGDLRIAGATPPGAAASPPDGSAGGRIERAVESVEQAMIRDAMERLGGNKKRVARELGISRSYLYKKLTQADPAS